jgi:hypothetical protein
VSDDAGAALSCVTDNECHSSHMTVYKSDMTDFTVIDFLRRNLLRLVSATEREDRICLSSPNVNVSIGKYLLIVVKVGRKLRKNYALITTPRIVT